MELHRHGLDAWPSPGLTWGGRIEKRTGSGLATGSIRRTGPRGLSCICIFAHEDRRDRTGFDILLLSSRCSLSVRVFSNLLCKHLRTFSSSSTQSCCVFPPAIVRCFKRFGGLTCSLLHTRLVAAYSFARRRHMPVFLANFILRCVPRARAAQRNFRAAYAAAYLRFVTPHNGDKTTYMEFYLSIHLVLVLGDIRRSHSTACTPSRLLPRTHAARGGHLSSLSPATPRLRLRAPPICFAVAIHGTSVCAARRQRSSRFSVVRRMTCGVHALRRILPPCVPRTPVRHILRVVHLLYLL